MRFFLIINGGSSSLRFALFEVAKELKQVLTGRFERIGLPDSKLMVGKEESMVNIPDHAACIPMLTKLLEKNLSMSELGAIGHRVVHGGLRYRETQRVDDEMLKELRRISSFAPEHLPSQIALLEAFAVQHPGVPQIACFDTAFHCSLPRVATLLPIPRKYEKQGVQRYGFHGLSYAYLMQELEHVAGAKVSKGRVILAHLGNGASMAAVRDGHCIDTTMSFTPTAGLVMSTRSGDLDPGLVAYLAKTEGMTAEQFHKMVNSQSGLLGISETSSDMRDLIQQEKADVRSAEAVAIFCYQARKWIGALTAAMGGLDMLVFAGGIGENMPIIRARICEDLKFLGIEIDPSRNETNAPVITVNNGKTAVRVIHTNEELYIATSMLQLLS